MRSVRRRAKTTRMLALAVGVKLALATAPPLSGQETLLRFNPAEGQVSRYVFAMESTMESPMMPSTDPVFTFRVQQTQTVLSVADGVFQVRGTLDSVAVTSAMGADTMPDLTGSVVTTEMDARGRVLRVVDTEGLPEDGALMLEEIFDTPDYFALPEDAVRPGDSWVQTAEVSVPLGEADMATSSEFRVTFESLEGDIATLSFEGPMELSFDMGGMEMEATGHLAGSGIIDLAAGRYRSQETRMNLEMNFQGMAMATQTVSTLTLVPGS